MNKTHEYKGFTIIKRSGKTSRKGGAATGYAINTERGRLCFMTLTLAKSYIDELAAA